MIHNHRLRISIIVLLFLILSFLIPQDAQADCQGGDRCAYCRKDELLEDWLPLGWYIRAWYSYYSDGSECRGTTLVFWGGPNYSDTDCYWWFAEGTDVDGDGYQAIGSCPSPVANDCDDNDPDVYPEAPELCDGKDNNCDGEIDEGCELCTQEICDGEDNDCNGQIDETCNGCSPNSTDMGSSANLASGNLYHSQQVLGSHNTGLTANITIAYNSLDTTIGPLGRGWTHNYNTNITENEDTLVLVEEDGRRIYFHNSSVNTYSSDPVSGEHSTITKNADESYTLAEKTGIRYDYNSDGKLTGITDRNGNTLSLTYTGDDLTLITNSSGRVTTLVYDSNHRITSIIDNAGRITTFIYNSDFLSTVTDPSGNTWSYTYDADGRMLTKTDPLGYTTTYTYDANGKVILSQDPEGNTKTISYDQTNQIAYVTEKNSGQWIYKYDNALNVPLKVTDPLGNKTTYQYDSNRNLISKTEPDGGTTTYTYDADGNMTSQTDSLGNTTTYTYNSFGQITSITDPLGNITTYTYDTKGNLITITQPTGSSTQMTYDAKGNVTSITNPNGQTTIYTYDQYNNLISITDPTGATTSFTYDASGNMLTQTDAQGNITQFEYNNLNQLIKITDPSGNITIYTYDSNGNKTSETDANGNTTYYEYNYKSQLTKVTDALENVTTYTYGGGGCPSCGGGGDKLTSITDANGNTTTYQYNTLGRLISETDPLGNTITYTYNSRDNLIQKTDANGNTITYTYDSLNRLISKNYPDGTQETFTYDSKGDMITVSNQYITYTFTYDVNGRMTSTTDSNSRTINYAYDSLGNKIQMTTPEGETINYTYDSNNRLTQILSDVGNFGFAYDFLGRRTKLTYPNRVTTTYEYDNNTHLINLLTHNSQFETLNSYTYTHDNVGNRLTKTEIDRKYIYTYDTIYRLLQATPTKLKGKEKRQEHKAETFTYDPAGNRLTGPGEKDFYTYNQDNQLTSDKKYQYEYDGNGNLIKKIEMDDEGEEKTWTYSYDHENRLIKVVKQEEDEAKSVTFKYDPFGRRIEKSVEEVEEGQVKKAKIYTYVYDNEDIILEYLTKSEDGETKTEITRYVHGSGIDEPLAVEKKEKVFYYHADGLGSITALTDERQKVVESYEYDSFGNMKHRGHKVKQPYTFTGREYDSETGLYYYRARYYDPKIGRFISFDPILHPINGQSTYYSCSQVQNIFIPSLWSLKENPKNLNPYVYVENNPVNKIDPLGLADNNGIIKDIVDWCTEWFVCRTARAFYCEEKFGSPCRAGCARYDPATQEKQWRLCMYECSINHAGCLSSSKCPYKGRKLTG